MNKLNYIFHDPLKIRTDHFLAWGCTHFGHNPTWPIPIWARRNYKSVGEHDEGLIRNWNSRANSETIGFLLGDIIFGEKSIERLKIILSRLNFKELHICAGNHFAGFKQLLQLSDCYYKELVEDGNDIREDIIVHGPQYKVAENKIVYFYANYFEAFVNGQAFTCGHYPILSWNGQSHGTINLFSHVHGSLSNSELGRLFLASVRAVEVSVEINPFPLTLREIQDKVKDVKAFAPDHHTKDTKNPFG